MGFKRILCAVDFSDESNAAFRQAVELAERYSSKLFLLHALEVHPLVSQWMAPDGLGDLTLEIEERARASMEELEQSLGSESSGLSIHTEITSGRAYVEILENARVWEADLIVLGATGVGSLEEFTIGSTVDRVLKEAECSVLVVKA